MDYDQIRQAGYDDSQDFFTSGAGTNDENLNNFEAYNNITSDNDNWAPRHSQREIGNKINSIMEMPLPSAKPEQPTIPELGKVTSLEAVSIPPMEKPATPTTSAADSLINPSFNSIKTGEYLSEDGIAAIDEAIGNFRTGNESPAQFYDEIRDAMEGNLANSYQRKLGAA